MNDRFLCCKAAPEIMHLRHFSCCERARREKRIHRMGSDLPFAALCTKVRYGPLSQLFKIAYQRAGGTEYFDELVNYCVVKHIRVRQVLATPQADHF